MINKARRALLVLNAGSSSLKFSLYDCDQPGESRSCIGRGSVETGKEPERLVFVDEKGEHQEGWPCVRAVPTNDTMSRLMDWLERAVEPTIIAVAHRVVHGGDLEDVCAPVDAALMARMEALIPSAPLHQTRCLEPISYLARQHPGLRQFVCFDTVFHRTLLPLETQYGLPSALTDQGLRRYGFHGLSYQYIADALIDYDMRAAHGRTVVAHLGNGASLCGLHNRISRATTMGFSTLDGLLMGTRPGRLDPGILLYLLREQHMTVEALEDLLYHQCGLLGVSGGLTCDMRALAASPLPQARQAIDLFVHYVVREIGALAAVLGGIDALVFTGGIGEHAASVRNAILEGCRWLGVERDADNVQSHPNCLSQPASAVAAWMIPTDENAVIARHTLQRLQAAC